jgi:hypothetical protein
MKMFYELPATGGGTEDVIERMKIREIVEYERYCCDYGHKEEEKKLWFDDGRLFTTWFKGSIKDYLSSPVIAPEEAVGHDPIENHCHRVNDVIVWRKNSRAIAEMLAFLCFRNKINDTWEDTQCWCRFHYRLEKRDGNWGIVYFEGIYEKDRMDPVFQDETNKVSSDDIKEHRPINWNMGYRRGLVHSDVVSTESDWAGIDKPDTVRRLYEESSRWIGLSD